MAKCSICKTRKGKRKCKIENAFVCSLCCGQSRSADECTDCSFYKDDSTKRNYRKIPFYGTQQMSDSIELQDISNVIESSLCKFDTETENNFTDKMALQLLELAFDKYYFKDLELNFSNPALKSLFKRISQIIEKELSDTPLEKLVKILASIYRSIQRRTNGRREYLEFIQEYVGVRVGSGIRMLNF